MPDLASGGSAIQPFDLVLPDQLLIASWQPLRHRPDYADAAERRHRERERVKALQAATAAALADWSRLAARLEGNRVARVALGLHRPSAGFHDVVCGHCFEPGLEEADPMIWPCSTYTAMKEVPMPESEPDGYPPFPADGDFAALRAWANTMVVADMLAAEEEADRAMGGVFGFFTPKTPAERWEKAAQILAESQHIRQMTAPLDAALAGRPQPGEDPIATATRNFALAREACRTGHPDCRFGGLTPSSGYWLAGEGCELEHGEHCQIRLACEGDTPAGTFTGWGENWIWAVYVCAACADAWRKARPEWEPDAADRTQEAGASDA